MYESSMGGMNFNDSESIFSNIKFFNSGVFFIAVELLSNIRNASLTYLRGLEIAELKEEDMPMV
jgi:hypothetical protein